MKQYPIFASICMVVSSVSLAQFAPAREQEGILAAAEEQEGIAAGQDLLSQLAVQCDKLDQKYEVTFFVQALIPMSERNGAEIALQEHTVRQIRDRTNSVYRADVKSLQEASSGMTSWSHFLDLREQTLRADAHVRRNGLKVRKYAQNAQAPPMVWGYSNMVTSPLSGYALLQYRGHIDVLSLNMNMRVVEAKKIDGIFTLTLVPYKGGGGVVIEFKDKPAWIPVKVEMYSSDGEQVALDSADVAISLRSSGILLARIVSRWQEQSAGLWVPSYVRSANISRTKAETDVEIWFSDWKFADDVNGKLLTTESFDKEALLAIDFEKLRESVKKNISEEKRKVGANHDKNIP